MDQEQEFGIPKSAQQVHDLLPMIDPSWYESEDNWIFVGQCLFNVLAQEGKVVWRNFTPRRFADSLEREWRRFEKTRYGLPALRSIARSHSPELFEEWQIDLTNKAVLNSVSETSGITEIADIAKFLFGDVFVCSDIVNKRWWRFSGCWEQLSGGHSFRQKFSRVLVKLYSQILPHLTVAEDRDDPQAKMIKSMRMKCVNIIKGLKDPGFKSKLMMECSEIFYVDEFEEGLDENHFLLGLPDGVLDLKTFKKRRGYPEDWITLKMGVTYNPQKFDELRYEHPEVREVMSFFKKVLHEDELVKFSLRHKSTCLVGGNQEKWCVVYIGETAHNGKTTTQKWDKHVFGKYCGKFPLGSIVGKTLNAGTADPAQATSKGQRLKYADEANRNQEFNFSFIKTATGNDEIWARKLYSNGTTFTPQYTLLLLLNQLPRAGVDPAVWERFILLPHDTRFISNPPESPEEQEATRTYKADPFIDNRLKELAEAYLWVLVEELKMYLKEGIQKPKAVIDKTEVYRYKNDPYAQFVDAKVERTDRHMDYVELNDLYIDFKAWHTGAFPKSKIPDKQLFHDEAQRVLGKTEGAEKRWYGIKVKTNIRRFDN